MAFREDPIRINTSTPPDCEISQSVKPLPISDLLDVYGISSSNVDLYGDYKAKIKCDTLLDEWSDRQPGHYVCISATTPTPLGEGKTTITIGLNQAFGRHLNRRCISTIRQPSAGPTFGIKGGAAGGGYSQVIPMEELNLHLTGDIHAVALAHNLLTAALESRIFYESTQTDDVLFKKLVPINYHGERNFNEPQKRRLKKLGIPVDICPNDMSTDQMTSFSRLDINVASVTLPHVVDINSRSLRDIILYGDGPSAGYERSSRFEIAVASEIMAILALTKSMEDMKERLRCIVVAWDSKDDPITADDLCVAGALAAIMHNAIHPTVMQTLEGTPVMIHAGPFANIAHGASSVIADEAALRIVGTDGYVVTEAGFGADIGFEKFCNIKCRVSRHKPECVVLVTTVRSLKFHGGAPALIPGELIPEAYRHSDAHLVSVGCVNLTRHIRNCRKFGVGIIVAINLSSSDHADELQEIIKQAAIAGAFKTVTCTCWSEGGKGAVCLAEAIISYCETAPANLSKFDSTQFESLYPLRLGLKEKIDIVCRSIYGANGVEYTDAAEGQITLYEKKGFGDIPVCMAKTQYSISHDPMLIGSPMDFIVPVKRVSLSAGAGFVVVYCGNIMTMPGLPIRPAFFDVDVEESTGRIVGLF